MRNSVPAVLILAGLALGSPRVAVATTSELPGLGLVVGSVTPALALEAGLDQVKGCLVEAVASGSAAAAAGLQRGDIIVSLNGRGIRSPQELKNDLAGIEPGEVIKMCVVRNDYRTTVQFLCPGAPARRLADDSGWLGVEVSTIEPGSAEAAGLEAAGKEGGVVVVRVMDGSPAERVGFQRGDVVVSFNSRKVRTIRELVADIAGAKPGDKVRVCILRGDIRKTLYPVLSYPPRSPVTLAAGEGAAERELRVPTESELAVFFPGASRFARELEPVPHYRAYERDELLGVAFVTTEVCPKESEGYQGPIATLVALDVSGKIVGATLLYHTESVKNARERLEQFLRQYESMDAAGPFVLGRNIDAVTGATVTSSAINRSIEAGSRIVMAAVLGVSLPAVSSGGHSSWHLLTANVHAILLLGLAALALSGYFAGSQRVRFFVLGMALPFLGYLKAGGLSIHDVINVLEGHLPPFPATVYWYTLVAFVGLTSVFIGRFYCGWLCPFGALTEMLYRVVPRWKVTVPFRLDQALRLLKYLVLTTILALVLLLGQSDVVSAFVGVVEPFGTVFRLTGTFLSWLMVGVCLLGSIFVSRAYCRYFCPLGAVFALVAVSVSLVRRALLGIAPAMRHRALAASVGGCPVNAIAHDIDAAELGLRSGECIVCSRPAPLSRQARAAGRDEPR